MLRRIYKKWSSWWNGAVITDICGLKLNEICHHQMLLLDLLRPKSVCGRGSAPDPAGGSLQRSPSPPSWWGASQTQKPNFAHGRWEICRTNQNTAAIRPCNVPKLWKLAGSRQSSLRNKWAYFFGPPCIHRSPYHVNRRSATGLTFWRILYTGCVFHPSVNFQRFWRWLVFFLFFQTRCVLRTQQHSYISARRYKGRIVWR